jgi:hypothetical protein
MRNRLLVLGRFAHDPQSVLAAIHRLALVSIELCLNISFFIRKVRLELSVAPFADTDGGRGWFHDSQFAFLHDCSLAHLEGRP